jgi:hypothetical protein
MLALVATVGVSSPAWAALGEEANVPFSMTPGKYVLPVTLTAGDCREVGNNQTPTYVPSDLTVQPSGTPGLYSITWNATLYTVHTYYHDQWHATFVVRTSTGEEAFELHMDGPNMGNNHTYQYSATQTVTVSADQAASINRVDWIGDC